MCFHFFSLFCVSLDTTTRTHIAQVLGPRRGRFHDEKTGEPLSKPGNIQGHNVSLQLLGTFILWFGWYGFNAGSAFLNSTEFGDLLAMQAAANTTLAGGAGGLSALALNFLVTQRMTGRGKYDLVATMNGVLSGLVSVTAGCSLMTPLAAILVGLCAGCFYLAGSHFLIRNQMDDAVDAMPVHMVNGIWGMLAVGLFSTPELMKLNYGHDDIAGLFYPTGGRGGAVNLLGAQIVGILCIMTWIMVTMLPFFVFLQYIGQFRAHAMEEVHGLDKAYMAEGTYEYVCHAWKCAKR
jgi:ammonium transporter, Amt family